MLAGAVALAVGAPATRAAEPPWWDYQIIMWQDHGAVANAALKALGVSAAMVMADRSGEHPESVAAQRAPLHEVGLGWYLENIATDFYSAYHRWSGDRAVNWRFLDAKERHRARPSDLAAFLREPSLSDPAWLARIRDRLSAVVTAHRGDRPLYYDLADEPGIGDLAAAWDFDLGPASLDGLRAWLRTQYGDLDALNTEWGTRFARWDTVVPMTTDQALAREDDNFAAWADFKAWMDVAFARAVRAGTDAVHQADPHALAGIEGAQIPGWGGYDYTRLVGAVDLMEPYDYGDNIPIIRALKPDMILIVTSYRSGMAEQHRIWRELLRGTRGILLWDDKGEFVAPEGGFGPRARETAPLFAELRGGLGTLLINSVRLDDPIALLYSPASERTRWLLDRREEARTGGSNWAGRGASVEYEDTTIRTARHTALSTLEHVGLEPRIVSPAALETGALQRDDPHVLILPGAIALSDGEIAAIQDFTARGGRVVADGTPGAFDAHSRRRSAAPAIARSDGTLLDVVAAAGIVPPVHVEHADGGAADDVEIYRFRNGDVTILALLRDRADDAATRPALPVTVRLPRAAAITDLRAGAPIGRSDRVTVGLDDVAPTLLALTDQPTAAPAVALPHRARAGDAVPLAVTAPWSADVRTVFHVETVDPHGNVYARHTGNLLAQGGHAATTLRFARDDPTGRWHVTVTDRLSGQTTRAAIDLGRP